MYRQSSNSTCLYNKPFDQDTRKRGVNTERRRLTKKSFKPESIMRGHVERTFYIQGNMEKEPTG